MPTSSKRQLNKAVSLLMKIIVVINPLVKSQFSSIPGKFFSLSVAALRSQKVPFDRKRTSGGPEMDLILGLKLSILDFAVQMQ